MYRVDDLITLLRKDEIRNINALNFIEENAVLRVEKLGDSVLVQGESDPLWVYISSTNEDELKVLNEKLDVRDKYFAAIED